MTKSDKLSQVHEDIQRLDRMIAAFEATSRELDIGGRLFHDAHSNDKWQSITRKFNETVSPAFQSAAEQMKELRDDMIERALRVRKKGTA